MVEGGVQPTPLRGMLRRLTRSVHEQHADELRQESHERGGTLIAELRDRTRVHVSGTIRSVTLRPRGGVPALEAELYDGSASVTLVWLGRRRIAGIDPGRRVVVDGFFSRHDDRLLIFNPRYELRAGGAE